MDEHTRRCIWTLVTQLKRLGAYHEFRKNVVKLHETDYITHINEYLEEVKLQNPTDILMAFSNVKVSFYWMDTAEGYRFWQQMYRKLGEKRKQLTHIQDKCL